MFFHQKYFMPEVPSYPAALIVWITKKNLYNQNLCTLTNVLFPFSSLWMQRNRLKKSPYFPPLLISILRRSDTVSRRRSTQPIDSQTDSVSSTHRWLTGSRTSLSIKPLQSKTRVTCLWFWIRLTHRKLWAILSWF